MRRLTFFVICILIFFSMIQVMVNSALAKENLDCFTFTNDVTIDGTWTNSDEWNDAIEESLDFGKGSGEAYLRLKHDTENLYVLVDFLSYNETKTGDSCMVVLDTKHDGGSSARSDDLAVLIRWNTPTEIHPAIQWGGWTAEWELLPSNFVVNSSTDAEHNPYSTTPHLIFEFKIPKSSFKSSSTTLGFLVFLICDNENLNAALPLIQDASNPGNWADLKLFDNTIQIYYDAQTAIDSAYDVITKANSEGRTEGLDQAESLLEQAEATQGEHKYNETISLANQAIETAELATIPTQPPPTETPGFEIAIILISLVFLLFLKRKKKRS